MAETDQALLERFCREADEEAFADIVGRHGAMVYHTCLRVLRDPGRAEDAAQETFFRLLRGADRVQRSLPAWLHRTAVNRAIDVRRSEGARRDRERAWGREREDEKRARVVRRWSEISPHVDEALAELPDEARDLLVEHFLEGRAQAEIARRLEVSPATICRRTAEALTMLRRQLRRRGIAAVAGLLALWLPREAGAAMPAALARELGKMTMVGQTIPLGPVPEVPPASSPLDPPVLAPAAARDVAVTAPGTFDVTLAVLGGIRQRYGRWIFAGAVVGALVVLGLCLAGGIPAFGAVLAQMAAAQGGAS